jgi:hypothetical protein
MLTGNTVPINGRPIKSTRKSHMKNDIDQKVKNEILEIIKSVQEE